MALFDDIHNGLMNASNIIKNSATFGKLDGRMIGNSNGSAELLTRVVSRQIGESLLGKFSFHTDINCIRNPFSRRYERVDNTGIGNFNFNIPDSPLIGQLYDVYYHENDRIEFLDRTVAGDLMGYTHLQAAAEERNENPFLDKLFAVSTYNNFVEPEIYLNDVPFWRNLNIGSKRYTPRDPYATFPLYTYPVHRALNGEVQVFNNLFEIYDVESGPIQQATELDTYEFNRTTLLSHDGIANTEFFYQENTKPNAGQARDLTQDIHAGNSTLADVLELDRDNLKDIKGLLRKTNKLFNDGKVGSLINRFKTDILNGENIPSITNTAFNKQHGMSRGRNLTKPETTKENDYDNPYCRVWTSHHRYSKYNDLIRPFATSLNEDTLSSVAKPDGSISSQYYTQGDGFRPFDSNTRLSHMSTMDFESSKGRMPRPRFAPTYRNNGTTTDDDIKRCMFSIENLAWKDINFGAQVIGNGDKNKFTFGNTLTKEQRGPNGGRIMWFPPYNLKFSEQVSAQWNDNNFIGRGEPIKSYSNTTRRGQLSFTLLVDHPMIINQYTMDNLYGDNSKDKQDEDILRYFAGCGPLDLKIEKDKPIPTIDTYEYGTATEHRTVTDIVNEEQYLPADPVPEKTDIAPDLTFKVPFFYPNNYSGVDYDPAEALDILFRRGHRGSSNTGYELWELNSTGLTYPVGLGGKTYTSSGGQWSGQHPWYFGPNVNGGRQSWYYAANGKKITQILPDSNRYDRVSYGLNYGAFGGDSLHERVVNKGYLLGLSGNSVDWNETTNSGLTMMKQLLGNYLQSEDDPEMKYVLPSYFVYTGGIKDMIKLLESDEGISPKPKYKVKVDCVGYASVDGTKLNTIVSSADTVAGGSNKVLSEERANTVANWFKKYSGLDVEIGEVNGNGQLIGDKDVSSLQGKISRCAVATIKLINTNKAIEETPTNDVETEKIIVVPKEVTRDVERNYNYTAVTTSVSSASQLTTYDDEYKFFKQINEGEGEEFIKKYICDKVKYFDPAFHSITPEGFNARLTFLNQCTRQGPTISATDDEKATHSMGAGNLSFGRPPFCVLRIGDFFYTKICIDSLNITYDVDSGIKWDLNPEGIGVQPMMANVDISFTFLGGSDLSGPIDRLQNAVSHNFYANTSVYDRRADYRNVFRDEDDTAYSWEPTMNGDDMITKNRSLHIKYSSTKKVEQEELADLGLGRKVIDDKLKKIEPVKVPPLQTNNETFPRPQINKLNRI